jgi:hypothetical protein
VEGKGGRRKVEEADDDDDGVQQHQAPKDLENFSDELSEEEDDDQDDTIEWNENTANNVPAHAISNATLRTSSSKPHPYPSEPQEETPAFIIPSLEPEEAAIDLGPHDPTSLWAESEKTDTVPRVYDLTHLQLENEHNGTAAAVPGTQSEHTTPESSMSAEQRIKQLEEKVAKLNDLRLVDAASISRSSFSLSSLFSKISP